MAIRLRKRGRDNLLAAIRQMRSNARVDAKGRRNLLRVMNDEAIQDELAARLEKRYGIDVNNLIALLDAVLERLPQILALVSQIIEMFSRVAR
jgi:predicted house-cleaning noncanonical NTP pyrophosphatase (MazG superfamily)